MKLKFSFPTLISILFLSFMVACSGGQTTSDSNQDQGTDRSMELENARNALSDLTYSPYGKGFNYKATAVPAGDFRSWLNQFKEKIELALQNVGEGYVLQVTGHTDTSGPRDAEPATGKKGNVWYSTQRAQNVYKALNDMGVPTDRMTVSGAADDELLPGKDKYDQLNRRVTFKIVPAPTN